MINYELVDKIQDVVTLVAVPIAIILLIYITIRLEQIWRELK